MRELKADLHVHTALSPCGDDTMTPPLLVQKALDRGLGALAVCDHNAAGNAASVIRAAAGRLLVVPGIEITTCEEVHVLGWFEAADAALWVADAVRATLPEQTEQSERYFGVQTLMDEAGNAIGLEPRMLAAASEFSLAEAVALIREAGGIAAAAHVDRPAFSVISQLGVLPDDVEFDALEISSHAWREDRGEKWRAEGRVLTTGSDAHYPDDIGSVFTLFRVARPSFGELAAALRGLSGRNCRLA